jgi:hypothetical protein
MDELYGGLYNMRVKVQIVIESENHGTPITEEVACIQREDLTPETLGLTLAEAKDLLASMQANIVKEQTAEYIEQQRCCPLCGEMRGEKGQHDIVFRSLFGKMEISSPRLYTCSCQPQEKKSFSPLAEHLPERTAPELLYIQTKWASLMSYGLTVEHLEEVLPIQVNVTTVFRKMHTAAERIESELGDEQHVYVEGCQRDWESLPIPDDPITVGIDGGYVHARDDTNRKAGSFEVIVGKVITAEGVRKSFGFVNGYDQKPKRRLFETLKAQGLQMNQGITFLSDGGDTVRDLQLYLSPFAEHLLDWFHVTMRLTVMKQITKGLPEDQFLKDIGTDLERVKWYLWHGNVFRALQVIGDMQMDLDSVENDNPALGKMRQHVSEFNTYISNNKAFIPNYGDRYRYGEMISTAFAESTVNQVISKRMVKKQQMRWTQRGAHFLLQVRTKVLNDDWRNTFCRWYPAMTPTEGNIDCAA